MPKTKSQLNNHPNLQFFQSHIDKKQEQTKVIFRFDDFTETAQIKLCVLLKEYSRCWTVKKPVKDGGVDIKEIYHALRIANPVIVQNWNNGFYRGQIPADREKELSRLVYFLCRRNPTEETKQEIVSMIETPEDDYRRVSPNTAAQIRTLNDIMFSTLNFPTVHIDINQITA
mgnify:CR=1 FL=1